ncbi:MAG: PQQ-binding-like beta-propeller repeat protein, partial [Verrucomicrobiaceae bacterium]
MQLKTRIAGTASFTFLLLMLAACGPSNDQASSPANAGSRSAPASSAVPKKDVEVPQKKAAPVPTPDVPVSVIQAGKEDHNVYGWRGPLQSGGSLEHFKDGKLDLNPLWTRDAHGRGTPVIVDGRVFTFGYRGEKEELVEHLGCVDEKTGKQLWQIEIKDFISDTVYNRYSIGSPCVDPETKRVYLLTAYGVFICTDFDGKELWRHSLMEEIGRMTFPNSKVGSPTIEGDMVIIQGITANWGADGPAANRFYAFDKITGEIIWATTPGEIPPKDSSHSTPVFETRDGKRVFWVGTGCGNVVAVNARTGKPLFRHKVSKGGVNASVLLHKGNKVIALHGEENPDSSDKGRLVAIKLPEKFDAEQMVFDPEISPDKWKANEVWRASVRAETSSPTLAGDHVYLITEGGELTSVNADTGIVEWTKKLTNANVHASPYYADGLIFCSLLEGKLVVVKPGEKDAEIVQEIPLQGNGLGSPVICNGQLYVHMAERGDKPGKLYCFKINNGGIKYDLAPVAEIPKAGTAAALQIIPWEFVLHPGDKRPFKIRSIDKNGFVVGDVPKASWESFIPPTAKVKALLDGKFNDAGELVTEPAAKTSAG